MTKKSFLIFCALVSFLFSGCQSEHIKGFIVFGKWDGVYVAKKDDPFVLNFILLSDSPLTNVTSIDFPEIAHTIDDMQYDLIEGDKYKDFQLFNIAVNLHLKEVSSTTISKITLIFDQKYKETFPIGHIKLVVSEKGIFTPQNQYVTAYPNTQFFQAKLKNISEHTIQIKRVTVENSFLQIKDVKINDKSEKQSVEANETINIYFTLAEKSEQKADFYIVTPKIEYELAGKASSTYIDPVFYGVTTVTSEKLDDILKKN
ncbi:MAG: hypothetical protein K6T39_13370 [Anoxybacillus ayderensis]|nr:hypothetical protein [Anoxybacillus ayderensis]